jgi:argininosuccinate lyase
MMLEYVMERVEVNDRILEDESYMYLFSVEEVNKKVKEGIPFRDAYREVAFEIETSRFKPNRDHSYTHLGSIGNPGFLEVRAKLEQAHTGFDFVSTTKLAEELSNYYKKS